MADEGQKYSGSEVFDAAGIPWSGLGGGGKGAPGAREGGGESARASSVLHGTKSRKSGEGMSAGKAMLL